MPGGGRLLEGEHRLRGAQFVAANVAHGSRAPVQWPGQLVTNRTSERTAWGQTMAYA